MATFRPFQGIRPKKGLESEIAALPYDVYNSKEARAVVQKQPLSFLKIDRAETQFHEDTDTYASCVYEKARELLWGMVRDGELIKEEQPCYYIYELTMNGRTQTGIAGCASIDEYQNGTIKKHENTRADKEEDRIRHVDTCSAQTGPIFLAYRSNETVNTIVAHSKEQEALYDFISEDNIRHRIWKIDRVDVIDELKQAFMQIEQLYIADGHHRAASAVKTGLRRREKKVNYNNTEEFNYFLSVAFPDAQLMIMDYNRVVKDTNGLDKNELLEKIQQKFMIEEKAEAYQPEAKGMFGMFLDNQWYCITAKEEILSSHPVDGLDVSLLQNELLAPILAIKDPKTDKRIDFVGGIRGLAELEKRVHTDCKIAFSMYPTSIQELFAVADAGLLMPPKSTWFEPKLRSGLLIHEI